MSRSTVDVWNLSGLSGAHLSRDTTPIELDKIELVILQGLALGLSQKDIACRLGVSQHTVNARVRRLRHASNAGTVTELVLRAVHQGAVASPWVVSSKEQG